MTVTPPTLAARLQAALAQAVLAPGPGSKSWDRAGVEELLVTIGRDAAASGTRMADIAVAFLESIDSIDSDNNVGSPPGSRLAGLLRRLLGAYEAAREGRRGTGESNDSVARL